MAETAQQVGETHYVGSVARAVIRNSGASTPRAQVIALRDYLRAHVDFHGAPCRRRPFFRATAAETLRSHKGFCGEVTRAFICMAAAVGVRAERINLWGKQSHVVAEAELAPGDRVVVDCQNPPMIVGLERLDRVILRPQFQDYYTLNLRRLHLTWLVTRLKLQMGPLTYWTENPHALKAFLWFMIPVMLLALRAGRALVHLYLRRQGWIRTTDPGSLKATVMVGATDTTCAG